MPPRIFSLFKPAGKPVAGEALPEQIQRARAMHSQGRLEAAAELCREILAAHPGVADVHYIQANVLKDLGRLQAALADYDRAIALKPDFAHAVCNRAVVLGLLGRLPEALAAYDRALQIDAGDVLAHCNRGALLLRLGQDAEALACFDAAIALRGDFFQAHFSRGALLQKKREWAAALASYDRATAINPNDVATYCNRGSVLAELNRWEAALADYDRAIALDPTFHRAHAGRAAALHCQKRLIAALESHDRAIELNPNEASTHNNRGVVLLELGRLDAALASFERALAAKPDYAKAHFNHGSVLQRLDRLDAALASYERAIAANPQYADAHVNRGTVLGAMGRLADAMASYEQAIRVDPELGEAYYNLALAALKTGDMCRGWVNYEWRWRAQTGPIFREKRDFAQPLWLGDSHIGGKTILVYGEQGLGDSLQFCRYVPLVAKLGARVILEVPKPLVSLCTTLGGTTEVVAYGSPLPEFDFQCPMMSLPLVFETRLETIPSSSSYVSSDIKKVVSWQQQLGRKLKPRIGLTWSGNQTAGTNRNRHFSLSMLRPYLSDDFQYFCMQTDIAEADRNTLAQHPEIRCFSSALRDFSDTAALCECMDLVISVDTSVAHLSGALGRPTWVLLAFDADWRWLLDREDSPWYPSMRLFRQQSPGDWSGVFERVRAQLRSRLLNATAD